MNNDETLNKLTNRASNLTQEHNYNSAFLYYSKVLSLTRDKGIKKELKKILPQITPLMYTIPGGCNEIITLSIDKSGRYLLAGGQGVRPRYTNKPFGPAELLLFDLTSGKCIWQQEWNADKVNCIAIDNTSQYLAIGDFGKTCYLWDIVNGKLTGKLSGASFRLTTLAFNRNSTILAGGNVNEGIILWDTYSLSLIGTYKEKDMNGVNALLFYEDKKNNKELLITGSKDGKVRFWDYQKGQVVQTLDNLKPGTKALALDYKNNRLFIGCGYERVITAHSSYIRPDKNEYRREYYGNVLILDISSNEVIQSYDTSQVKSISISADGNYAAVNTASVVLSILDVRNKKLNLVKNLVSIDSCIHPKENVIFSTGNGDIIVFDAETQLIKDSLRGHKNRIVRTFLLNKDSDLLSCDADGECNIRDFKTGRLKHTFNIQPDFCGGNFAKYRLTQDGKYMAALHLIYGTGNCDLHIYELNNYTCINEKTKNKGYIFSLSFNQDSNLIAAAKNKSITISQIDTENIIKEIDNQSLGARVISFIPGKNAILCACERKVNDKENRPKIRYQLLAMDIDTENILFKSEKEDLFQIIGIEISPGGLYFATLESNGKVKFWDLSTGNLIQNRPDPCEEYFTAIAFNYQGSILALGCESSNILFWDFMKNEIKFKLRAHSHSVTTLSFNKSDTRLISTGKEKTLKVWDLSKKARITGNFIRRDRIYEKAIIDTGLFIEEEDERVVPSIEFDRVTK